MKPDGAALKALATVIGAYACFVLGFDVENGQVGREILVEAGMVAGVGTISATLGFHWHRPRRIRVRRPGTRRFRPGRDRAWLPNQAWLDFGDPLPDVPGVAGDPAVPAGEVPPDETLRRLWLVRAQLAAHHLAPAEDRITRVFRLAAGAISVVAVLTVTIGIWFDGRQWTLAVLSAGLFLAGSAGWSLVANRRIAKVVRRRKAALEREERRLMSQDQKRPGGPLGGLALEPGEVPYVPPPVPAERLG